MKLGLYLCKYLAQLLSSFFSFHFKNVSILLGEARVKKKEVFKFDNLRRPAVLVAHWCKTERFFAVLWMALVA